MYNINDIRTLHFEVTSRCQASCPMCSRNLQGGVTNPFITETQISLEQFTNWFSKDFVKQLDRLYMCGNLGDPIIAQDTLEIFKYLRNNNSNINLSMHTNGSARTTEWWQELAHTGVRVIFGIDGLEDTHKLYRVGTDWHKIIKNAYSFIQAGGEAEWHMLVFKHNEHQIEECRKISEDMGFKHFASKNSSRFREDGIQVIDKIGRTTHKIYPTEKSKKLSDKVYKLNEISVKSTITCKASQEKSLYISATGNVSPCCWTDMEWMLPTRFARIDYMNKINDFYNLNKNSLSDIFSTNYFNTITNTWDDSPLLACSKNCGTVDRLNEQFK